MVQQGVDPGAHPGSEEGDGVPGADEVLDVLGEGVELVAVRGLQLVEGDQQPAALGVGERGEAVQHDGERLPLPLVALDDVARGAERGDPRGGEAGGLRLGIQLAQSGDRLPAQLLDERGRGRVHPQVDPARLEGELAELGEQHCLAGAALAGDEDRSRFGDVAGERGGELVDRDVAAGEDHRCEPEAGGEGVRHGDIVPCVSVYV